MEQWKLRRIHCLGFIRLVLIYFGVPRSESTKDTTKTGRWKATKKSNKTIRSVHASLNRKETADPSATPCASPRFGGWGSKSQQDRVPIPDQQRPFSVIFPRQQNSKWNEESEGGQCTESFSDRSRTRAITRSMQIKQARQVMKRWARYRLGIIFASFIRTQII